MKAGIHPEYSEATISCACGYKIKTRSTVGDICAPWPVQWSMRSKAIRNGCSAPAATGL